MGDRQVAESENTNSHEQGISSVGGNLSVPLSESCRVQGRFGRLNCKILVDSGASVSCMSASFFGGTGLKGNYPIKPSSLSALQDASGNNLTRMGEVTIPFQIEQNLVWHTFHILQTISSPVIIGRDFLFSHQAPLQFKEKTLKFASPMPSPDICSSISRSAPVHLSTKVLVQPSERKLVPVRINSKFKGGVGLAQSTASLFRDHHMVGASCMIDVDKQSKSAVYEIYNPSNTTVVLYPGTILAVVEPCPEVNIIGSFDNIYGNRPTIENLEANSQKQEARGTDDSNMKRASEILTELGIDLSDADLTDDQKGRMITFLATHRNVFAKDMSEIGCTNLHEHSIDTGDATPQKRCYSRMTPAEKIDVDKQVDEMLENGIISPCSSPWISPVILVAKKTGGFRFAVDYRLLNKVTKPISFPPVSLDDVVDTVGQSQARPSSQLLIFFLVTGKCH
jgi:hypothetical protein